MQPPVSLAVLKIPEATPALAGGAAASAMPFKGIVRTAPVPPSSIPGTSAA